MAKGAFKKILSPTNPLIKELIELREKREVREEKGAVLVFQEVVIKELMKEVAPLALFIEEGCEKRLIQEGFKAEEMTLVSKSVFEKLGKGLFHGLSALFPLPEESALKGKKYILALDKIADPGNVGTLIRTAAALGWEGVFITEGSCDPFNEKALRASRGQALLLPFRRGSFDELLQFAEEEQLELFIADPEGDDLAQVGKRESALLLLSNEARGARKCSQGRLIAIPHSSKVESLNVAIAGGILMYALR